MLKGGGGTVPSTWWSHDFAGHTDAAKKELHEIMQGQGESFFTPKPTSLIERILEITTDENSVILDSFAGSGTTAHAVLKVNQKDGGNRRFILIECEDYADTLTAERVRRVISGYPYKGIQRDELLNQKITWSTFEKKQPELLKQIESIENLQGHEYDKIKKEIKDGVLTVTGERAIKKTRQGLRGSFSYCQLGEPIQLDSLLSGEGMPAFESLARYVFYTATGQSLDTVAPPSANGFIGETALFRIYLIYQPDRDWLRGNEAALTAERVELIEKNNNSNKRCIVFAVAKFMSQKVLTGKRIEFCQLPYAVHRMLGD